MDIDDVGVLIVPGGVGRLGGDDLGLWCVAGRPV